MNKYLIVILLMLPGIAISATWINVDSKIKSLGSSWDINQSCVYLESGDVIKLQMDTNKGKSEFSILLTAYTKQQMIRVQFDQDSALTGNCNTGATINKHGPVRILQ